MNDKFLRSKTQNRTFALENATYIVWFKWNHSWIFHTIGWFHLT